MNVIPPEVFDLPFDEAIAWFRSKRFNFPTRRYDDLTSEEYAYGFAVAGVQNALQLQDFRNAVDRYIAEGRSVQDFRKDFDEISKRYGWSYNGERNWRSEIIANTNAFSAYGWGRWEQLNDPDLMAFRPFRQIIAGGSIEPNPKHSYLTGMVLPSDDPIWNQLGPPPWDYGCKHQIIAISREDAKKRKISNGKDIPIDNIVNRQTGQKSKVVRGVSPQFAKGETLEQIRRGVLERQFNILSRTLLAALVYLGLIPKPISIPTPVPSPVPIPVKDPLAEFAGFQFQALTAAAINTALDASRLKFSKDPKVALAQLIERGLFNFALANVIGFTTKDFGVPVSLGAQLLVSGYTITEASRIFQKNLQRAGAEQIRRRFGQQTLDRIANQLRQRKVNQRTYVIPGLNELAPQSSLYGIEIGEELKRNGLKGDFVAFANPTLFGESSSFQELVLQAVLKYDDLSQQIAEQIIYDLSTGRINKINLVGHSSGANIAENVAAILAEAGIQVDDIVTWGSEGIPTLLGENTRLRRYFSDRDIFQVLRIPEPNEFDRFFEDVYHSLAEYRFFGIKDIPPVWNTAPEVLKATVQDFNQFLELPETRPDRLLPAPRSADQINQDRQSIRQRVGSVNYNDLSAATRTLVTPPPARPALTRRPEVFVRGIDINEADVFTLINDLNLTTRQAANLKRYINQNGPIQNLDDLLKVPDIGQKTVADLKLLPSVVIAQPRTVAEIRALLEPVKGINRDAIAQSIFEDISQNGFYTDEQDLRRRLSQIRGVGNRTIQELVDRQLFSRFTGRTISAEVLPTRPIELGPPQIFPTSTSSATTPTPQTNIEPILPTVDDIRERLKSVRGIARERVAQAIADDILQNGPFTSPEDLQNRLVRIPGAGPKVYQALIDQGIITVRSPSRAIPQTVSSVSQVRDAISNVKGINKNRVSEAIFEEIQSGGQFRNKEDARARLLALRGIGPTTVEAILSNLFTEE